MGYSKFILFSSLLITSFLVVSCGGSKDKSADVAKAMQDKINALMAQSQQQGEAYKQELLAQTTQLNQAKDAALAACSGQIAQATQTISNAALIAAASGQDVNGAIKAAAAQASGSLNAADPCTNNIRQFIVLWSSTAGGQYANTQQGLDYALNFFKVMGDQAATQMPPYLISNPQYQCALLGAGQTLTNSMANQAGYSSYSNLVNSYYTQAGAATNCVVQ